MNDSDGDGHLIYRAPDFQDIDLESSSWTLFSGIDGLLYDLRTSAAVYVLNEILFDYVFNKQTEEWEYVFLPVGDAGFEKTLAATMDDGDLYVFEMEIGNDDVTYLPVGVVEQYAMNTDPYSPGDLGMFWA